MLTKDIIHRIPKVELHEHLDGGLRPSTVIELARERGIKLPENDPEKLADWFRRGSRQKSLSLYLESFAVTTSVMQDRESLFRTAKEEIEDLAAENAVYAEIRFAPAIHTAKGLSLEDVVSTVLSGLQAGKKECGTEYGLILCAMRHESPELSLKIAELAVAFRDRGVVGFDLAGDECGNPAKDHIKAFQYIRNRNFCITIHAGEAFGVESIWQAVQMCGAHRIGHGVRLIEDMVTEDGKILKMGSLAHFIRDRRIPLEMCLTSNADTGAVKSISEHPFPILYRNHFRVFLSSDNRLMSGTDLTHEMEIAVKEYGLTLDDLEKITVNAMKSAFIHHDEKLRIIYGVIKKGYSGIRSSLQLS